MIAVYSPRLLAIPPWIEYLGPAKSALEESELFQLAYSILWVMVTDRVGMIHIELVG